MSKNIPDPDFYEKVRGPDPDDYVPETKTWIPPKKDEARQYQTTSEEPTSAQESEAAFAEENSEPENRSGRSILLQEGAKKGYAQLCEDAKALKRIQKWDDNRLAKKADVGESVIIRFFRTGKRPYDVNLYKICDALGMRVSDYIDDKREKIVSKPESDFLNTRFGRKLNARYRGIFAVCEDALILLNRVLEPGNKTPEKTDIAELIGEYKGIKTALCGYENYPEELGKITRKEYNKSKKEDSQ